MHTVRVMAEGDWAAVRRIYRAGMDTGLATFETQVPEWSSWDSAHTAEHRFVAVADAGGHETVLGWVACSTVSSRCVYAGVLELSVYVDPAAHGRGVGSALVRRVVASSEDAGVWTLQAGVLVENRASIALHERHGFRVVGVRERLGRRDGVWRDVVLLERRSAVVGV